MIFRDIKKIHRQTASPTSNYIATLNNGQKVFIKGYMSARSENDREEIKRLYLDDISKQINKKYKHGNITSRYTSTKQSIDRPSSSIKKTTSVNLGGVRQYMHDKSEMAINEYLRGIDGVIYEKNVYSEIVKTIDDKKLSPNFLKFIDYYEDENIIDFLIGTNEVRKNNDTSSVYDYKIDELKKFLITISFPTVIKNALGNTILFYLSESTVDKIVRNHCKICLIMTELIPDCRGLYDGILASNFLPRRIMGKYDMTLWDGIFFQIFHILYTMKLVRLQHNDLHYKNIIIQKFDTPVKLNYRVDFYDKTRNEVFCEDFVIETKYVLKIFDWDLSYHVSLNDNPKLKDYYYKKIGIVNKFIGGYDLYTIMCYLNKAGSYIPLDELNSIQKDKRLNLDQIYNPEYPPKSGLYPNTSSLFFRHDDSFYDCRPNSNVERILDALMDADEFLLTSRFDKFKPARPATSSEIYNFEQDMYHLNYDLI